eukprot:4984842-Pleurochrysis_carterae.AAC.1
MAPQQRLRQQLVHAARVGGGHGRPRLAALIPAMCDRRVPAPSVRALCQSQRPHPCPQPARVGHRCVLASPCAQRALRE